MKASILDLRYKSKEVLKALDSNEYVEILYHGKLKGIIHPVNIESDIKVKDHPFFNMLSESNNSNESVLAELDKLRSTRYAL